MEPAVSRDILSVAAALFFAYSVVVFAQMEAQPCKEGSTERRIPACYSLRKRGYSDIGIISYDGDKAAVFVNDDGATAAEAPDEREALPATLLLIDEC